MADERGNLALEFLRLAERLRARWVLWENVPGVLSSNDGRDFGAFIGGLAELGYGSCWRSLDAQHFGLAQRRVRVFVVGYLGDWRRAAAVLFEPASLRGDSAPSREAGKTTAPTLASRASAGGGLGTDFDCDVRAQAQPSHRADSDTYIAHSLRAEGFDAGEDGTGRGTPLVAFDARQSDVITYGDMSGPLDTDGHSVAVAFAQNQRDEVRCMDCGPTMAAATDRASPQPPGCVASPRGNASASRASLTAGLTWCIAGRPQRMGRAIGRWATRSPCLSSGGSRGGWCVRMPRARSRECLPHEPAPRPCFDGLRVGAERGRYVDPGGDIF
jgi:hypothetical protein